MAVTPLYIDKLAAKDTLSDDDLVIIGEGDDAKKMTIAQLKEELGINALNTKTDITSQIIPGDSHIGIKKATKIGNIVMISGELKTGYAAGWHSETLENPYPPISEVSLNICRPSTAGDSETSIKMAYVNDGRLAGYCTAALNGNIGFSVVYICA